MEEVFVVASKMEAVKMEAAKIEAAKMEAVKMEAAKMEAAKMEAAKMKVEVLCWHCRSNNVKFMFFNNKKADQHRFKCMDCEAWFTWEDHKRPKPKHYTKVRNKDPIEFQGQQIICNKCSAVNNARFRFYNNKKKYGESQPRFKCLSCKNFFQMYFKGGTLVPGKSSIITKPRKKAREVTAPTACDPCEGDVGDVEQIGRYHVGIVQQPGQCFNYSLDGACQYFAGSSEQAAVFSEYVDNGGGGRFDVLGSVRNLVVQCRTRTMEVCKIWNRQASGAITPTTRSDVIQVMLLLITCVHLNLMRQAWNEKLNSFNVVQVGEDYNDNGKRDYNTDRTAAICEQLPWDFYLFLGQRTKSDVVKSNLYVHNYLKNPCKVLILHCSIKTVFTRFSSCTDLHAT